VVRGWISTCDVSKEFGTCGTDFVCELADKYICEPLHLKCSPSRKFVICNAGTTDKMHQCFLIVVEWVTMFLLHRE